MFILQVLAAPLDTLILVNITKFTVSRSKDGVTEKRADPTMIGYTFLV